ncbi:MAG: translation initiation factor IF-2 [Chlorobi bacterium]|nr:translation initiation factor IF-2 [Chlorobiota bacterium]
MSQNIPEKKLFKVAKYFNISKEEIVEYLTAKGFQISNKPSFELTDEMLDAVTGHFAKEAKHAERVRSKIEQFERTHQQSVKKKTVAPSETESEEVRQTGIEAPPEESHETTSPPAEVSIEELSTVEAEQTILEPTFAEQQPSSVAVPLDVEQLTAVPVESQRIETTISEEPESAVIDSTEPIVSTSVSVEESVSSEEPDVTMTTADLADTSSSVSPESTEVKPLPSDIIAEAPVEETVEQQPTLEQSEDAPDPKRRRRVSNILVTSEPDTPSTSWKLRGLTVVGKIELPVEEPRRSKRGAKKLEKPEKLSEPQKRNVRPSRVKDKEKQHSTKREEQPQEQLPTPILATTSSGALKTKDKKLTTKDAFFATDDKAQKKRKPIRELIAEEEVERAIRETLAGIEEEARIRSRIKKQKKQQREERQQRRLEQLQQEHGVLRITEFVTTAELANFLGVSPAEIISKCFALGLMVSINQRLDRDTIQLIASDYGVTVEFLTDKEITLEEETLADPSESLVPRPPIVTIMGHVDHGKTSLLDYIRSSSIVAGEAGGITQHIGAYKVILPNGKSITFLDTPGHEAFTAMRARGAQVTDIVVLVVAADDSVMPQTIEAISHAQAAGVPIVVAINKIDKDTANPDRIKQQLADHGVLVEEWGGKYQCAEISAKKGINVDILLEKILLDAELLDLKANPNRTALGTVIEAHVDKGRGNVATVLVQSGTLRQGDTFICGQYFGRVRAMYDERGHRVEEAPPSTPVQVTGFEGLPEAGDKLVVSHDEDKLRQIAQQRQILRREQQLRQVKRVSLDEISKRMQHGGIKELRIVLKADVSGSLEALTDSLQKLSTDEVTISIIHRAVGAITESDVMLAAASEAIVVGFQVQLPASVRKVAERESVDVRLYSIIYDAINEIQLALEGMLSPEIKEEVTGRAEVRQVFRISKVGTVAGCYIMSGTVTRNDKARVIRDGFEIYKGTIQSLKHLKDDVREVRQGYECGLTISGFNDYTEGDIIETYRITEVQRKLGQ